MADSALPDLYASTPGFLSAADNHNLGNTQTSWLDPETYSAKLGNAGKFIAASILSGADSFYQTAAQVGKWVGADDGTPTRSTQDFISGIDSDLGTYYRANKESVDLAGFVLGSIVPGLGGVKILNAGQLALKAARAEGLIGGNLARATGLLAPDTQKFVSLAANEINASLSTTKILNTNTLKAIGAGYWQNTLEAAAFETVVQATMFKSPILEQQDLGDIVTNIAVGGVVGGTIGAVFSTPGLLGKVKRAVGQEKIDRLPFIERPQFAEITSPSERIAALAWDSEMSATPVVLRNADGTIVPNNYAVNKTLYEDKLRKNFNDMRTEIHKLIPGGDDELGNIIANSSTPFIDTATGFYKPGYAQGYFDSFSGAQHLVRAKEITPLELAAQKAAKDGKIPEVDIASRYVKIIGDDVGQVLDDLPPILSLADTAKNQGAVFSKVREYKFDLKSGWDASALKGVNAHLEAEARQIWANHVLKEIPDGVTISEFDLPILERLYTEQSDKFSKIKISRGEGPTLESWTPGSKQELYDLIKENKVETANRILQRQSLDGSIPIEQGTAAAAKISNTRQSFLEGTSQASEFSDLFVHQTDQVKYIEGIRAKGLTLKGDEVTDPLLLPKIAKVVYAVDKNVKDVNGAIADAMTFYQAQQKIYQQGAKNVVAKVLGEGAENLPDITTRMTAAMDHTTAGAGFVSFSNSNYGTWGSTMEWIGSQVRGFKQAARKEVTNGLESSLVKLGQNPEAAIEFESINQKISRSGKLWVQHTDEDGVRYLVQKEAKAALDNPEAGVSIGDIESGQLIKIEGAETAEAVSAHITAAGKRTNHFKDIRAQQGLEDLKDPDVFRPIRPDLKQYPHFAFVVDPKVTGSGHVTMIHAASEKELAGLLDKVPEGYTKLLKTDVEEFKKARMEYEHSRTLNENYLDSEMASKGVFSNFFPKTDPEKIVNDILQQHLRESDTLVTETVRLRYEPQFNLLEDMGRQYSKTDTSRFASRAEILEKSVDNPYFNHIKTALDISKVSENPLWASFNKGLDSAVSKFTGTLQDTWKGVKSPEELEKINAVLDKYGMKPAYYDAALNALANHEAPKGALTSFIRKGNSLLSLFTLGLDPLNSLNNAIGANILRMSELKHLTDAIKAGNEEVAGALASVAKINLPGTGDQILAPTKLVGKALENFWKDDGTLLTRYKDLGLIKDRVEQLKLLVDDFTLKGTETVGELTDRSSRAFQRAKDLTDKGEVLSGNKLAEEFNRFISANVMEQITDIGKKAGLLDDATSKAYINTFVNRVEGNITASQRPLVFQGPVGQAVGLFQSYQFNLLQQMFRYVGEGTGKDVATLLGLQSTLYGIQSLPAFQFINTHIVGQLSGNKEHRDAYDATYGITGRTAGDFILYGIPSNILQTNIYSRGDINPRQITVLPTSLQEIPLTQGWGKFLGNIKETVGKVAGGGAVWESILQGMEHNGVSRPMAGFAQTLRGLKDGQVTSTQQNGNILYQNDLMSWATIVRMAGGRPLDEAVTNDALFRVKTYDAARRQDMASLAEKVKSTMIGGASPDVESVNHFAEKYASLGGKQAGFNKWMMGLYKDTNVTQAEQLRASLTNPFAYKMQELMGGTEE